MADNTTLNAATGGDVIASDDIGGVKFQRFKLVHGADGVNAGDVSTANPYPVFMPDASVTGTLTATDAVGGVPAGAGAFINAASTAGSIVAIACPGGDSAWNVQITGMTTGAIYYEGSLDSTNGTNGNWIAVNGRQTGVVNTVLSNNATTNGAYRGNTSGLLYFRVRQTGTYTATPAIIIRVSDGTGAVFLNASTPAGTNLTGYTEGTAGALLARDGTDISAPTAMPAGGVGIRGWLSAIWTKLNGTLGVTGTFWQATQPVSLATNTPTLQAGSAIVGALVANQTVNIALTNGVAPLMGNGVSGTGSQRVNIASDNTAFPVNATLSAETTKVIGTVNVAAAQSIAVTNAGTFAVQTPPTTLAVTATAAANTGVTLTLPAAGAGLFHYITGIEIARNATAALAGTATLVITTTNLSGSLAWSVGNAMAAGGTQIDETRAFSNPFKSSVANTATTIVMPVPGAAVLWRANVYYYTGV